MTQLDSDLKAANKAADILIAEALRLREQRDELLAALEGLLVALDGHFKGFDPKPGSPVGKARAAIKKAKS